MADTPVAPRPRRCLVAGCGGPLRIIVLPGGATGEACEWCEQRLAQHRVAMAIYRGAIDAYQSEITVARVVMNLERQVAHLTTALEEAQSEAARLSVRAAQSLSPVEHQIMRLLPDEKSLAMSNKGLRARIPGVTKSGVRKALLSLEDRGLVVCVLNQTRHSRQDDWTRYYRSEPLTGSKRPKRREHNAVEQYGLPIEVVPA